jgi:hypothetical protein
VLSYKTHKEVVNRVKGVPAFFVRQQLCSQNTGAETVEPLCALGAELRSGDSQDCHSLQLQCQALRLVLDSE